MKRILYWSVWVGFLLVVNCVPTVPPPQDHDSAFSAEGLLAASDDQLPTTEITPHLGAGILPRRNTLWCGTFQLAWNEACALVGEDLHFVDEPPMVAELNRKAFTRADLDDESYLALAGFVRDGIFEKIDRGLREKFQGRASPHLLPRPKTPLRPWDIVTYAYLFKHLEFRTPFERLAEPLAFADGGKVPAFGMREYKPGHHAMYAQVRILDYRSPTDFVVELMTKSAGDRLVLARVEPAGTLEETVAGVQKRLAAGGAEPVTAEAGDVLVVPKLNFDLTRDYRELRGLLLVVDNPKVARDLEIVSAMQNIRFQMDEKGVRLRSEAHVFTCRAAAAPRPRHIMVFDGPFLLLMQRTASRTPYFALWVGNSDLLVKWKESAR